MKNTKTNRSLVLAILALVCLATPAPAAVITWGTVDGTDAIVDISDNGTLVNAYNAGGGGDKLVNGTTFAAANSDPLGSAITGFLSGTVAGFTSADPIYTLISAVSYGGGAGVTTVPLQNLEAGKQYEVQIFFADRRAASKMQDYGDGEGGGLGNSVRLQGGTDIGDFMGQNVIGTFTADSTTQSLTMDPPVVGNSHINAYQVREVPEPATMSLLALGGIAMLRRRKK